MNKYAQLQDSYIVVPICVETLGSWGPNSIKFIAELGNKIKAETKEPSPTCYPMQAISVAIQRGNAPSVLGTVLASKSLDEVYSL